jgi:nitrogen fixation NifU-like protein
VGEISNADGIGEVGNLRCGDVMYVYIKVGGRPRQSRDKLQAEGETLSATEGRAKRGGSEEEYIEDIKFKTLGCAAAIASTSMMTELVKGKSLEDAMKVTRDDINEALGILPKQKYHCSILSADGIRKAVENYRASKAVGR